MDATRTERWTSSTFGRGPSRVEWRVDGDHVLLRHSGHAEEGLLTLSMTEWRSFIAAARAGQAGGTAY